MEEYAFKDSYKFSDKCPNYSRLEQYKMFIDSRLEDITNIHKAINEAKQHISNIESLIPIGTYIDSGFLGLDKIIDYEYEGSLESACYILENSGCVYIKAVKKPTITQRIKNVVT
jgi:hypothetical protein